MGRKSRDPGRLDELRQLKIENRKLKRQLAQARKQVLKVLKQDEVDPSDLLPIVVETAKPDESCPKCQSQLRDVDLGARSFQICPACKYRRSR